jgi:hypothetical protein
MLRVNSIIVMVILLINYSTYNAQGNITGFTISPTNPTTIDTIYIYANIQFSSSGCEIDNSNYTILGNTISAYSQHCLGMLTTICPTTDTFKIEPLSSGNYYFVFTLTSGFGGPPCSPGIVADDLDTLLFNVTNSTTEIIESNINSNIAFYPNPSKGKLSYLISNTKTTNNEIIIYSIDGKIINSYLINSNVGNINLNLESGIYFIRLKDHKGNLSFVEKIVVK